MAYLVSFVTSVDHSSILRFGQVHIAFACSFELLGWVAANAGSREGVNTLSVVRS